MVLKLSVRFLKSAIDVEVTMVKVEVSQSDEVVKLRKKLEMTGFPLPQDYIFMHKMSVMFETTTFNGHNMLDDEHHTIDVISVPKQPSTMGDSITALVSIRGSKSISQRDYEATQKSSTIVPDSCRKKGGTFTLFHQLATTSGLCFANLQNDRKLSTYPAIRNNDTIHIVDMLKNKRLNLKFGVIVEGKEITVEPNPFKQVKQLRDELKKRELCLPQQYCFIMVVCNSHYLMDEEVRLAWYLMYHHGEGDLRYKDGVVQVGSSHIVRVKVCPYNEILNNNNSESPASFFAVGR